MARRWQQPLNIGLKFHSLQAAHLLPDMKTHIPLHAMRNMPNSKFFKRVIVVVDAHGRPHEVSDVFFACMALVPALSCKGLTARHVTTALSPCLNVASAPFVCQKRFLSTWNKKHNMPSRPPPNLSLSSQISYDCLVSSGQRHARLSSGWSSLMRLLKASIGDTVVLTRYEEREKGVLHVSIEKGGG